MIPLFELLDIGADFVYDAGKFMAVQKSISNNRWNSHILYPMMNPVGLF